MSLKGADRRLRWRLDQQRLSLPEMNTTDPYCNPAAIAVKLPAQFLRTARAGGHAAVYRAQRTAQVRVQTIEVIRRNGNRCSWLNHSHHADDDSKPR